MSKKEDAANEAIDKIVDPILDKYFRDLKRKSKTNAQGKDDGKKVI